MGAVKLTDAPPLLLVAEIPVGAPGAVIAAVGVTAAEGLGAMPVPTALVAVTVKV
jgi:hypothetical protein